MTEALQAAIKALEETDHTRLPVHIVAEIVLREATPAIRRELLGQASAMSPRPERRGKLRAV